MTGRRLRFEVAESRRVSLAFHAEKENGSAASELRCRCVRLHHGSGPWTQRIQGCGATPRRLVASAPFCRTLAPRDNIAPECRNIQQGADMTQRIPEDFSAAEWRLVTIMGN